MEPQITNPILPGFNPDPSIIRVGEDYYLATSTFEWFPGVQIYHSTDLQNWEPVARPLNRLSQLDMKGCDISAGVFAPCLSYCDGVFYLMYTNVRSHWYDFMDCHNYLVTATDIRGEWSEPVYIHSAGFDPSLFHDDDGRKWVVSVMRQHRGMAMGGICLQEYDPIGQQMKGPMEIIFQGSLGFGGGEGAHLYHLNGWYYLITAEGGTEFGHAVTMSRSRTIAGPYEMHPQTPLLTSRDSLSLPIQRAGHADLVCTPQNEWYMVFLGSRPLPPNRRSVLGRESYINKMEWHEDGWLYPVAGGHHPTLLTPAPKGCAPAPRKNHSKHYAFAPGELDMDFLSLRIPLDETMLSLNARPGYLRLIGKDSPNSRFEQSLVARRQQAFSYTATTCLEFEPQSVKQFAGLMAIYDSDDFYYLNVTQNEQGEKAVDVMVMEHAALSFPCQSIPIPRDAPCWLQARVRGTSLQFYYSLDGQTYRAIGPALDQTKLSDEYSQQGAYTGAMVGLACSDMLTRSACADFAFFDYQELDD